MMKLRWSPTSPFVRKVVVLMKEKGIEDLIEKEKSNPLSREDRAATPSPLGKIPCLVTADGQPVFDSPVIMEYLDTVCEGPEMLPKSGDARWMVLRRQATADGMIDSMVTCFVESLKKPERQSGGILAHNKAIVFKAIAALEQEAAAFGDTVDIGTISVAVALSFANQTFPIDDWRAEHPVLAAWFDSFDQRPSMRESVLVDARSFE
jgi:glutathione S-transferase